VIDKSILPQETYVIDKSILLQAEEIIEVSKELEAKLAVEYDHHEIRRLNQRFKELEAQALSAHRLLQLFREYQELLEMQIEMDIEESELADIKNKLEVAKLVFQAALKARSQCSGNAIIEFKPGTGGDEAALFAGDLWRMYLCYAKYKDWQWEVLDFQTSEGGGIKQARAKLVHSDGLAIMRPEGGVHRVQRIPDTESKGRIHTSTAVICILPEAKNEDIEINKSDLQIEVCRSSGPGGQSVNTSNSAVSIVHKPTGIRVSQQDERSQRQNQEKAMRILKERLLQKKREEEELLVRNERSSQSASRSRSDKIRTYNFPQNRITDHRYNITHYKLDRAIKTGQKELEDFLNEVRARYDAEDQDI